MRSGGFANNLHQFPQSGGFEKSANAATGDPDIWSLTTSHSGKAGNVLCSENIRFDAGLFAIQILRSCKKIKENRPLTSPL